MSHKVLLNHLSVVFPPKTAELLHKEMIGRSKKVVTLAAEVAHTFDFDEYAFHEIVLGTQNPTLNADVSGQGLVPGERVYVKLTQGTPARIVTWGTGFLTDVTPSAVAGAIDLYEGVFDGTNIILGAISQNAS